MNGDEVQMAFFERRTWITGLDPVPGVDEWTKHLDSRHERGCGLIGRSEEVQVGL